LASPPWVATRRNSQMRFHAHALPPGFDPLRYFQNPRQRTDVRCFAGETPVTDFSGAMGRSFGRVREEVFGEVGGHAARSQPKETYP
jgi:hypothetical protein